MNIDQIRNQFPILSQPARNGNRLVYLDNASTTQKPQSVINAITNFYSSSNANIHRGVHFLSEKATLEVENARQKLARFIGCDHPEEILFTKGTTEGINLVAETWGRSNLKQGDLIILTEAEHHANLVPWIALSQEIGFEIAYIPISVEGEFDMKTYKLLLERKPKFVGFVHISNVLGMVIDAKKVARLAKSAGAVVLVDGAQSLVHQQINVQSIGCDFYCFSLHKMYGPLGLGVLWGKKSILNEMPPYQKGGDMIKKVSYDRVEYADLPARFECGTPNIASIVAVCQTIDFLQEVGYNTISSHDKALTEYALEGLRSVGAQIIGPQTVEGRVGVLSFVYKDFHPHDIATILDENGVAVRSGHHCVMPFHYEKGIHATTRASFAIYNTVEEVDRLIESLEKVGKILI